MSTICFFGADHKCGTSMIAQSIAERLSFENKKLSILLLHLECEDVNLFSPTVSENIENIGPYIKEKLIDADEVFKTSTYKENLHIIAGAKISLKNEYTHPDIAKNLLESLSDKFDYIICDCGADISYGPSLGALVFADKVYLVLTQKESAIRRYEYLMPLVNMLGIKVNKLILNKYDPFEVTNEKVFLSRLSLTKEDYIKVLNSSYGNLAETRQQSILSLRDTKFAKAISMIARDILKDD